MFAKTIQSVGMGLLLLVAACQSSGQKKEKKAKVTDTASRDELTKDVGKYPPPPAGAARPRVGVPPFQVSSTSYRVQNAETVAADQASTLLFKTKRFRVIERAQLEQLLKEQNLQGVVRPGEMARPAQVRGVDFLLIGKITNLQMRSETKRSGWSVRGIGTRKTETSITVECGVDLRLVDPSTGEALAMEFSEYKRTQSAGATGWNVRGYRVSSDASIRLDEENLGKILRLALDDTIKKMLPDIDYELVRMGQERSTKPAGN